MALLQSEARSLTPNFFETRAFSKESLRLFAVGVRLGRFAASEVQETEYGADVLREIACARLPNAVEDPVAGSDAFEAAERARVVARLRVG